MKTKIFRRLITFLSLPSVTPGGNVVLIPGAHQGGTRHAWASWLGRCAALLVSLTAYPAIAADGDVDIGFDPQVLGVVFTTTAQADGKLVIGGDFLSVSSSPRNRIARVNANGTLDSGFNPNANLAIRSTAVQADGKILIAGEFTTVGGTARSRIARLHTDGTLDTAFNPSANAPVYCTAIQPDGKIVIGGSFTAVGGAARNRIARLNADGTFDDGFDPGVGANFTVYSMALQSDGKIVIGGSFTAVGGTAKFRIARLNDDGTIDTAFNPATDSTVNSIMVQTDGKLVIGGSFTWLGGASRNRIARLNADGTLDLGFDPNVSSGSGSAVYTIAVQQDGKIVIAGEFSSVGAITRNSIARLSADGAVDPGFNPNVSGRVDSTALQVDGNIVIAGGFSSVGGTSRGSCARLLNSPMETSFNPNADFLVQSTAVQPDGKIVMGGDFGMVGGMVRNRIARLNADGTVDTGFDPGAGATGRVLTTAVQEDGKIVIGGLFTTVGGVPRNRIARLNADGSMDTGFDPDANNAVYSTALQEDGKMLIGGNFTALGVATRNHVARLNSNGSVDLGFDPNVDNAVYSTALQADGKIVIGGSFTTVGGMARNRIARLNADGTLDTGFNPGIGANGDIKTMVVQADGKIVIGGWFTSMNGTARNRMARLNPDGTQDIGFNPDVRGAEVLSMAAQADGRMLIAGDFIWVGGASRSGIARINADGTLDTGFKPELAGGFLSHPVVFSLAVQAEGKVVIGGGFTSVGGTARNNIARLFNRPATQILTVPSVAEVKWLRGGTVPEVTQVVFEFSTDETTWTELGAGTRISGGWELTGLSLPASGAIRARARAVGGINNGSSGLVEQQVTFSGLPVPEIAVEQPPGTDLIDGTATIDFGNVLVGSSSAARTFTITNGGTADLTGLAITTDGSYPADFIVGPLGATTLTPGASTTFTVTFTPAALGSRSAALHLASNDFDENPFDIALTGRGAAEGELDSAFNPRANDYVFSTAVQPDGRILIGGWFSLVGGVARNSIARLNPDGTIDAGFNPGANRWVYSTLVERDGKITIGGFFNSAAGIPRSRIARFHADGALDAGFDPNVNYEIEGMALQQDGRILLGGDFTSIGGTPRNHVARLHPDGTVDAGFNPDANARVWTTAVEEDGGILIGGGFTMIGGVARNGLARYHADGTMDDDFNPNVSGYVFAVMPQADGKIIIGGTFTAVGGVSRSRLARLHSDGTLDEGFMADANDDVYSLALQADGRILIGGWFTTVGGIGRNRIARLNADGTLDAGFNPDINDRVFGVALQGDGKILVAGAFSRVNDVSRSCIARVVNGPAPQSLTVPTSTRVQWLRGGTLPETTRANFELSTDGTIWTGLGAGIRIPGGWELTGISLPTNGAIRASARAIGGEYNGSSGLVEQQVSFSGLAIPEIAVEQPAGTDLVDGAASIEFGNVLVGSTSASRTFTITNSGTADLTGLAITTDGSHPDDFTVGTLGATILTPGASTTFTVTFTPAVLGSRSAALHLASNDFDENPFDVALIGTGARAGDLDTSFDPAMNGTVLATTIQTDGKVIIGGGFTNVGGIARNNIARLTADDALDLGFNPDVNGTVDCMAVQPDGKILLGGYLRSVGGMPTGSFARINSDGSPDTGFNPGVNNMVWCTSPQENGQIVIGGEFTSVGGMVRNYIARLNIDGSLDSSFNSELNGRVLSVAPQEDGKIMIGGDFTSVNGVAHSYIARLNEDGTLDTTFNSTPDREVRNVALQADGKIIVGGYFYSVNGVPRQFIARLLSNGAVDSGFIHPNSDALPFSTMIQADGKIVVAGYFTTIGGTTRNKIARLHPDGSLDSGFNPIPNEWVWSAMSQQDGKLLIAGGFTSVDGVPRNHIARLLNDKATQSLSVPGFNRVKWLRGGTVPETTQVAFELSTDGSTWTSLGSGKRIAGGWDLTGLSLPESGMIRARARTSGSHLNGSSGLVEQQASFSGLAVPEIAVEQPVGTDLTDGTASIDFGNVMVGSSSPAKTFTITNHGTADLTGLEITTDGSYPEDFTVGDPGATTLTPGESTTFTVSFTPAAIGSRSAALHLASNDFDEDLFDLTLSGNGVVEGDLDSGFDPDLNDFIRTTAVQPDGKVVFGGYFTTVGGTARNRIARINADGTLDSGFNPNANNGVYTATVQADGRIVIGGWFTTVGGTTRNRIARLNADGTLDPGFNPNADVIVTTSAVQADGKIVIGGGFFNVGGAARNRIARLNADGSADPSFDPNANEGVVTTTVQEDGKILMGGFFTTVGGTARNRIARINPDGTVDNSFNPNANDVVWSSVVQADGKIIIGGWFTTVGGVTRNHLARLHADGTLDMDFNPNANNWVFSTALQTDGKCVIAGSFTMLGGSPRNYIARLHADGTLDTGFNPSANDWAISTALQADGSILVGGLFTTVGGTTRNRLARLLNGPATHFLTVPTAARVEWQRGGTSPETVQVNFDLSTGGTAWTALGAGTRTSGGWELTGLNLPESGTIRARARTTGGYQNGSSGLVESIKPYLTDWPPALTTVSITSGNTNAAFAKPADVVTLDFTASEPIQTPVVTIAGKPATVTNPSGNQWSGTVTVAEGDTQGVAAFSIDFKDLAGNNGSQVTETTDSSSVTVDTAAPVLTLPPNQSAEATGASGATVHYPAATATDNFTAFPVIGYSQASGTIFPPDTTTVTVTATDSAGNLATGTFAVLVTDTTPPTITILGANPATLVAGTVYSDEGATATDLVDGTLAVTPTCDVDANVVGEYSVIYTATDAHSNTATATRTVIVKPSWPVMTTLYSKNGVVPGAGESDSGIPAGAIWKDFGIPAINDATTVTVIGSWDSPSGRGIGIFVDDALAVKAGEPVPGISGATWKSFLDPVLAADGSIAFVAQIEGRHVSKSNDTVVAREGSGGLPMILARTGNTAPGTGGAKFGAFNALSIDGPSVTFAAKLAKGTGNPKVTPDNDDAVWASDPTNPLALVVRQGRTIWLSNGPATKLKAFDFLTEIRGSPGMGRGDHAWDGTNTNVRFRAVLTDGRSAQMMAVPGGAPVAISESGAGVGRPSIAGATFRNFGLPASDHAGTRMAFLATLTKGSGGVTPANAQGIFLFNPTTSLFDAVARLGYPAPDTDGVFCAFDDPVFAADNSALAWVGLAEGGTVTRADDTAIWWQPDGEAALLVVREGEEPSGVPGAKWKSFDSLALPGTGHGPLFLASLVTGFGRHPGPGGVTNDTDKGLWALDSTDTLQLLVRNGVTQIDGQTVKSFTALQAVKGSPGVTRSFNSSATVVWRANFTHDGIGIIKTTVP